LSPLPIPGVVSTGLIFPFSYMSTNISTTCTLLHPFLLSFPSHWYQPPYRTYFTFLSVLHFR
jgi:hypothetical protein